MLIRPHNLDEACQALADAPGVVLSGGTDVFPALADRPSPPRVVDISAVRALDGISQASGEVRIGARTTWARIAGAAHLPPGFAMLREAAREVGSVQIQNVATIGGNLCNASPAADGVPSLLALDASVELASRAGTRRLPVSEFLLGYRLTARRPDELLTAVIVPEEAAAGSSAFVKLGSRRYLVISIVMAAAIVRLEGGRVGAARVAVGSCSAVARRLPALEAALAGADPGRLPDLVRPEHLDALSPIDDGRATSAYRQEAALEIVRRALARCVA